jgi:hypothetical protein
LCNIDIRKRQAVLFEKRTKNFHLLVSVLTEKYAILFSRLNKVRAAMAVASGAPALIWTTFAPPDDARAEWTQNGALIRKVGHDEVEQLFHLHVGSAEGVTHSSIPKHQ